MIEKIEKAYSLLWEVYEDLLSGKISKYEAWEAYQCATIAYRIVSKINDENNYAVVSPWITERPPVDEMQVFVYLYGDSPYIAWRSKGKWFTDEFEVDEEYYPTAWIPLPKPYEEEDEE